MDEALELDLYRKDFNVVANHSCLGRVIRTIVLVSIICSIPVLSPISKGGGQIVGVIIIFAGMFIADRYIRRTYPDWPKKKNFIGKIILGEKTITVVDGSRKEHLLCDCSELVLFYNYYTGFSVNHRDLQQNGNGLLFFKNKNTEVFVYKFNIPNKERFSRFLELTQKYKESLNYFKEYIPEDIGHILKADLSGRIIYKKLS